MQEISSFDGPVRDRVADGYTFVTWDLETLDDFEQDLEHEPVVGYSLTFAEAPLDAVPDELPTVAVVADDLDDEAALLRSLCDHFRSWGGDVTLVSHNGAYTQPNVDGGGPGYDSRKLLERCRAHDLAAGFIRSMPTYDTMDEAAGAYRHPDHGGRSTWLGLELLTDLFRIRPPTKFSDLGKDLRAIWQRGDLERVLLYNAADAMTETIIAALFRHQQHVCPAGDGLISHRNTCDHLHDGISIADYADWQRLKDRTAFRDVPV